MTTAIDHLPEPDSLSVSRRLRMYMGDKRITRSQLALASGIKRPTLSNKLDNQSEFTLHEINAIAHAINKSWIWVLTGAEIIPPGRGPDGGAEPPRGIEPLTYSLRVSSHQHQNRQHARHKKAS